MSRCAALPAPTIVYQTQPLSCPGAPVYYKECLESPSGGVTQKELQQRPLMDADKAKALRNRIRRTYH